MTAEDIAKKYVHGLNDALTDSQEIKDMMLDIEIYAEKYHQDKLKNKIHNKEINWEIELIGRNIHSVFTWCKDCGIQGCNTPLKDECGNCGSKNTVRYYDKETIDLLFNSDYKSVIPS